MRQDDPSSQSPNRDLTATKLAIFRSSKGYTYISHGDRCVGLHRLLACVDIDPHAVFGENNDVHHRVGQLDFSANLEILSRSEHIRRHSGGSNSTTLDQVLSTSASTPTEGDD